MIRDDQDLDSSAQCCTTGVAAYRTPRGVYRLIRSKPIS